MRFAKIREVVYPEGGESDSLVGAEHYVERLWEDLQKNGSENRGFLVFDLRGKQGFYGFREPENANINEQMQQKIWLADRNSDRKVALGSVPKGAPGVYYFNLEETPMAIDSPEAVKPYVEYGEFQGI